MQKKVDEIVKNILPKEEKPTLVKLPVGVIANDAPSYFYNIGIRQCKKELTKSLSSGVLVVPMSRLEIFQILKRTYYELSELTGDQLWLKLSEVLHTAQTKKPTE